MSRARVMAFASFLALIGAMGLLSYGAWLIAPPAGYILAGIQLWVIAYGINKALIQEGRR